MRVLDGQRIARARRRYDYSQTDLANMVGVTQQYISLIETGADSDISERVALAIAKRLGADLEYLFDTREIPRVHRNTRSKQGNKR